MGKGRIATKALEGSVGLDLDIGITAGFQYGRRLNDKLSLETGITWYKNQVNVTPSHVPGNDMTTKNYDIQLLYVPIFLKVNVFKRFYLNGGLIGDMDITKDKFITNQSGIGAGAGLGAEFSIAKKLMMQINPYVNLHGIILTNNEKYPERVFDTGFKIGIRTK